MCGIVGSIDLNGRDCLDPALTRAMTDRITHRGPDGDGFFHAPGVSLGMRRLSIIDVEGGDQPIFNEDGTIALVFNGEIYNYLELREDLIRRGHEFTTLADTETIVHLYEEYGTDLFDHLRGMYGFALWDAQRGQLLLAVDHIGIKPLYLAEHNGRLTFASETKALLTDPGVEAALNLPVLDTYLSFGYMLGEQTMFAGIKRLTPGHYLTIDTNSGTIDIQPFWQWRNADQDVMTPAHIPTDRNEAVTLVREMLRESVRLHLRSDVPLGLFLSGGIDSAAMLALMSEFEPGSVETFTVGYDIATGDNELEQARRIADHFNTTHHELVISAEDYWRHFTAFVFQNDEPVANPSIVSLQALAEETARSVKVVLNGTGGDELFCGYASHMTWPGLIRTGRRLDHIMPEQWRRRLIGGPMGALEAWYPAMKRQRIIGALPFYLPRWQMPFLPQEEALRRNASFEGYVHSEGLRNRLYSPALNDARRQALHKEQAYHDILLMAQARNQHPADIVQGLAALAWLPSNALLTADKVTMAHSLELRVPFFDRPLLNTAISLPGDLKTLGNKWLLREAMRPYLPQWALERPKKWFGSPVLEWLDGPLRQRTQEILLDERTLSRGYFQRQALTQLLENHFTRRENHIQMVIRLLILELWQRSFIDNARYNGH